MSFLWVTNKANLLSDLIDRSSGGLVSLSTEGKAQCLPVVFDKRL